MPRPRLGVLGNVHAADVTIRITFVLLGKTLKRFARGTGDGAGNASHAGEIVGSQDDDGCVLAILHLRRHKFDRDELRRRGVRIRIFRHLPIAMIAAAGRR